MKQRTKMIAQRLVSRRMRLRPVALSVMCLGMGSAIAQTLPTGFTPVGGGLTMSQIGALMTINQTTQRGIANWTNFSIGAGGTVNIVQPNISAVMLNRVVGVNTPSVIAGTLRTSLEGNPAAVGGRVYLINPSGIVFNSTAQVNVGGLVASTLDIAGADEAARNATFMAGGVANPSTKLMEMPFSGTSDSAVTVQPGAVITAGNGEGRTGGLVALMGASVSNAGAINVARGTAGLVAAQEVVVVVDPVGDGLTTFRIPATNAAKTALAENAGTGTIIADGGRVVLMGDGMQPGTVVNQAGTIQARSLEQRNGEVVLSAPGREMSVAGAIDASGGSIVMAARRIAVGDLTVNASGGTGGPNGKWEIQSEGSIYVRPPAGAGEPSDSNINAQAIAGALSRGTDVALSTSEGRGDASNNIRFGAGAEVIKTGGPRTALTVNSGNSIFMEAGSAIRSTGSALDVDFSSNAQAAPLATVPLDFNDARNGRIVLDHASIETNGGDIRFHGQGDRANGRALGVEVRNGSRLTTCAGSDGACGGTGVIEIRSVGETLNAGRSGGLANSSAGIQIAGSALSSGAGAIRLDGQGGTGSAGVIVMDGQDGKGQFAMSSLQSQTGDIVLVGSSRGWKAGDQGTLFTGTADAGGNTRGAGSGVAISTSTIATGGNIRIEGQGGNIDALTQDAAFVAAAANPDPVNGNFFAAGQGVDIAFSSVTAGKGREISITGTAGTGSFTAKDQGGPAPNPVLTFSDIGAFGANIVALAPSEGGAGRVLSAESGRITVRGVNSDVNISTTLPGGPLLLAAAAAPPPPPMAMSVGSATGAGGTITVTGRNVVIGLDGSALLDASGAGQAGSIDIRATAVEGVTNSGVVAVGAGSRLSADASSAVGNGGSVRVVGDKTLLAYGQFSARGGSAGGNGGSIETSGGAFDLRGARADASAPMGTAGTWLIDPFNVDIIGGVATGSLTGNPFVPLANSVIQDGDINAALNAGTSVTIGTGTGGLATDGDIHMHDAGFLGSKTAVNINYSADKGPVTFQLDANRSVRGDRNVVIQSTGKGALNVVFNADANNGGLATGGGQVSYSGNIITNGGDVTMKGQWANASNGNYSVHLDGNVIDTRVGGSDAGPGGAVTIVGNSIGGRDFFPEAAVGIDGVQISTATGKVNITGTATMATGVDLGSRFVATGVANRQTVISTTTGNINIVGIGNNTGNSSGTAPGHGVVIDQSALRSVDGNISVRGLRQAGGPLVGDGVRLTTGAQVSTSGTGNIELTGRSEGNGAGVRIGPVAPLGGTFPPVNASVDVAAGGNLVLRASNDGTADALVIDGTAKAGNVLNLRPGGVDAAGNAFDQTAAPIVLGGAAATGFAVSAAEFTRIAAGNTVVAGSDVHAGNIDVIGPLSLPSALTLQNGGGGNIQLGGAITTTQLGLQSAGNIGQAAGAAITANTLLARSSGGSVVLDNAANNVGTVGGGAAGQFTYVDADALTIAPVAVTGFGAADNTPQVLAATSMAADRVLVRTMSQDLTLNTGVTSGSGADLVAAARFQNPGGGTLGGAAWRVWADTWLGETRGGLQGSGLLPNLYHCAYLGLCAVSVPAGANHFIYTQQPVATVVIGNASRPFGFPNPLFSYGIGGLILGDTGAGFSGVPGTSATQASLPGSYPITGSFTSAEGYAVNVVPGNLVVTNARPVLPSPDVLRDLPTTWLYDRNVGPPPICFATGDNNASPATQGGDLLAREWTRVRSRPNLSSCVDTEKRNGCSDF